MLFEGHPVEWLFDVDADGHWVATEYDYFGGAEASKGWAPEYIERLSIADADQSWKFARAWTLGEVITALLAPACASKPSPSTRSIGGAAMRTSATMSAAGSRCRSPSSVAAATDRAHEPGGPGQALVRPANRPSRSRSIRLTASTAAGGIGP